MVAAMGFGKNGCGKSTFKCLAAKGSSLSEHFDVYCWITKHLVK